MYQNEQYPFPRQHAPQKGKRVSPSWDVGFGKLMGASTDEGDWSGLASVSSEHSGVKADGELSPMPAVAFEKHECDAPHGIPGKLAVAMVRRRAARVHRRTGIGDFPSETLALSTRRPSPSLGAILKTNRTSSRDSPPRRKVRRVMTR
jgi:hypothetical protein